MFTFKTCDNCGEEYLINPFVPTNGLCYDCYDVALKQLYDAEVAQDGYSRHVTRRTCTECEKYYYSKACYRRPHRPFCSWECERIWNNRRRRNRRAQRNRRKLICHQCGDAILNASRSDSRYCCNACRQKAYRQRKNGTPLSVADA